MNQCGTINNCIDMEVPDFQKERFHYIQNVIKNYRSDFEAVIENCKGHWKEKLTS